MKYPRSWCRLFGHRFRFGFCTRCHRNIHLVSLVARMRRWEVFDPIDGAPVCRVPFAWLAYILSRLVSLDYARTGEGWTR